MHRVVLLYAACAALCACEPLVDGVPHGSGARAADRLASTAGGVPGATADGAAQPPFDSSAVDPFFHTKRVEAGAPGMSVAVIKGGRVRWAKGYGLADLQTQQPATPDTLYMLGSISKTVVAVMLMQLIAEPARGLTLDSDISGSMGRLVRNPNFPSIPITFKMVLTHTTSILDHDSSLAITRGDWLSPLGPFLESQLANRQGWLTEPPGTRHEYSNTGFTLAGHLVERISGLDLEAYSQQRVFSQVGMTESSWFFRNLDRSHIAMPYQAEGSAFVPQGLYSWPTYPAGHLITSAVQLARYLATIARGGELDGRRLLSPASVAELLKEQIPAIDSSQGLAWFGVPAYDGRLILGHSGGFLGVSADMWFDPATGAGYVLLTNGSAYYNEYVLRRTGEAALASHGAAMAEIGGKLLEIATSMP